MSHGERKDSLVGIESCYSTSVFSGEGFAGNPCQCFLINSEVTDAQCADISSYSEFTCSFLRRVGNALRVRCYKAGVRIAFCGHGLVAAIHVWAQRQGLWQGEHSFGNYSLHVDDGRGGSLAQWHRQRLWLSVAIEPCRDLSMPYDIDQWFDPAPELMAHCGGDSDYRIFAWGGGMDIATVAINLEWLSSGGDGSDRPDLHTQENNIPTQNSGKRAMILTQAERIDAHQFTLRYLAPQYDVREDPATGSAAAVATRFWFERGMKPPFYVEQRSPGGGGLILTDICADRVLISGTVIVRGT